MAQDPRAHWQELDSLRRQVADLEARLAEVKAETALVPDLLSALKVLVASEAAPC